MAEGVVGVRLFQTFLGGEGEGGNPIIGPITNTNPEGGCGGGGAWDVQAGRFYESPLVRILVTDLDGIVVTTLDHLGMDRVILAKLNHPWQIECRVPSDHDEVNRHYAGDDLPYVSEGVRLVHVLFREADFSGTAAQGGPWVSRASGVVLHVEDAAETGQPYTRWTAWDPWQYLFRREVPRPDGTVLPRKGARWNDTRGNLIALQCLKRAIDNSSVSAPAGAQACFIDFGDGSRIGEGAQYQDWGGTSFYQGTIEQTDQLDFDVQRGKSVGEVWSDLVRTGTMDIVLTPIYDPKNRPGIIAEGSIYQQAGVQRNGAIFAWDMPGKSLVTIDREQEGSGRANKIRFFNGQGGKAVPLQTHAASVALFGDYWAQQFFVSQTKQVAVAAMAAWQLELRKEGQRTVNVTPTPERSPIPFVEYTIGDRVAVYASERFRETVGAAALTDTVVYQRVYGIPIEISNDALLRVRQLLCSPEGV